MANKRNKLSMLKAVFKDLEKGLSKDSLPYQDFEKFGEMLNSISQTYEVVKKDRRQEKLNSLIAERDAKDKEIEKIKAEIEADKK